MTSRGGDKKKSRLERREFIKLGASGVAVTLATYTGATSAQESASSAEAPEFDGTELPTAEAATDTPSADGIGDPEFTLFEDWQEPWIWRPEQWGEDPLELNAVRHHSPGPSPSPGNIGTRVFSYNGSSPGPTIRVRNDGEVRVRLRNVMNLNRADTAIEPAADPVDYTPDVETQICSLVEAELRGGDPENPRPCNPLFFPEQANKIAGYETRPGWSLKGHMNGQHCSHTTNIHTHGLHVSPEKNADGSHSDNVLLRCIPQADWQARQSSADTFLHKLADHEHAGKLDYKFEIAFARKGKRMPHPPGTHWYHPHSHGATHEQVSSGMAGYFIIEGDVDDAINNALTGKANPDPEIPTGKYDYRERLMFIQRAQITSGDPDAGPGPGRNRLRFPLRTDGPPEPPLMRMRPGAVERWRVLNGSVDGAGTKRFMVLEGLYTQREDRIWRVHSEGDRRNRKRHLEAVAESDYENLKLDLQQLSFDGITLVKEENGKARHFIKDLSQQNDGTENPFAATGRPGENEYQTLLRGFESIFRDGDSLRRTYVRPNEVFLTNANRTDLFFKAPMDSDGKIFTVIAKEAHFHSDNFQRFLQRRSVDSKANARRERFDTIVGYIHVRGRPVEGGDFDIQSLNDVLPPVPPLLQPVKAEELRVDRKEARKTGVKAGSLRTRTISYSGFGGADYPLIQVPDEFAARNPELENKRWGKSGGLNVLLPNLTRTMAINPDFDLSVDPNPGQPRKFNPHDERRPVTLLDTAEEWVLYNSSMTLWSQRNLEKKPQPGSWQNHFVSYPISRAEGQKRYAADPDFMISARGNDHPFHIHINPMWVMRIDVPDENGELHNVLPEPMWMDTVAIPRNGGRVVFRSRFEDFVGKWVNHCHVLSHEDLGMMQIVECTDDPARVNYKTRQTVADSTMSGKQVDAIYPVPSLELMYMQNMTFVDTNEIGGQEYPGFPITPPKLGNV